MVKVFIPKFLESIPHIPLLIPNLGRVKFGGELFKEDVFRNFKDPAVEIVSNILDADFILMPHNFSLVTGNKEYLKIFSDLNEKYKKQIIIFAYGDRDIKVDLSETIVFKYSMYKGPRALNEIKMPLYVEDLGGVVEIKSRGKHDSLPIVGFCGWADYGGYFLMAKALIKNLMINFQSVFYGKNWKFHKKGIYFRIKVIDKLLSSKLIKPNFIIRKTFSSHKSTIEANPKLARKQYVNNILDSDFSLAIRGDANDSMRFYEILSLGRIPILIDTDSILPLEEKIDYSDFILRISGDDFYKLDEVIMNFYKNISENEFIDMQVKARDAFSRYLRIDSYLKYIFSDPKVILSKINR